MDIKDIENLSLKDLGSFVEKMQNTVNEQLASMSKEDRNKVDDIVKDINTLDLNSLQKKSVKLKEELDASKC